MNEAEARTKWCPMYRCSTDHGQLTDNATHSSGGYCCASDCMMWRGELTRKEAENGYRPENGHCGLGGNP